MFKKIPNWIINLIYNKNFLAIDDDYKKILILYIFIYMYCNVNGEFITNIDILSKLCELSNDKRTANNIKYKKLLDILNDDILDQNNKLLVSKILDVEYFIECTTENNNITNNNNNNNNITENNATTNNNINNNNKNSILKITVFENNNFNSDYTPLYYNEFDKLIEIAKLYNNENSKKINLSTFINIYMFLKLNINKNENINNLNYYFCSLESLSKKLNINKRTALSYLNILEKYKVLKIKKGNYENKLCNKYFIEKFFEK